MKAFLSIFVVALFLFSCKNESQEASLKKINNLEDVEFNRDTIKPSLLKIKEKLKTDGYKFFEYVDDKTKDTILIQQYFMVFLKRGPIRDQNEEEFSKIQKAHIEHLKHMYNKGFVDVSGDFDDDSDIINVTVYNVPTFEIADSLAHLDPMVKTGRLIVEVHPWWAAKESILK